VERFRFDDRPVQVFAGIAIIIFCGVRDTIFAYFAIWSGSAKGDRLRRAFEIVAAQGRGVG
jgi:hypothetical protein